MQQLTAQMIVDALAGLTSLLFFLVPFLKTRYEELPSELKPVIQAAIMALLGIAWLLIKCNFSAICLEASIGETIRVIIEAWGINQGVYIALVKYRNRKMKAARLAAEKVLGL